jgi:predicted AAA+ superfamily ATPase
MPMTGNDAKILEVLVCMTIARTRRSEMNSKIVDGELIQPWFDRELYDDLLFWKNEQLSEPKAMVVRGPRQIGKTTAIKLFGENEFKKAVYLDLYDDDLRKELELELAKSTKKYGSLNSKGKFFIDAMEGIGADYENSKDCLVIIDEIQESHKIYNRIRRIRRELDSFLIVSGSYLSLINLDENFKMPAGDTRRIFAKPVSYLAYLKGSPVWEEYKSIETVSWDSKNGQDETGKVYAKVRECYLDYCKIGGYPRILKAFLENGSYSREVNETFEDFREESMRKTEEYISSETWKRVYEVVISCLIDKSYGRVIDILENSKYPAGYFKKTKLSQVNSAINWLTFSGTISPIRIVRRLGTNFGNFVGDRYYFQDMAFMNYIKELYDATESGLRGYIAENFVFTCLDAMKRDLGYKEILTYEKEGAKGQIDFVVLMPDNIKIGIEVKSGAGSTPTGALALKEGMIDYLVKLQDSAGSIQENQATIPIYAIDKLIPLFERFKAKHDI